MSETQIETYKDWEIALVCLQDPRKRSGTFRFIGFAYIRRAEKPERQWSAPQIVPKRGVLHYETRALAYRALRIEAKRHIDAISKSPPK